MDKDNVEILAKEMTPEGKLFGKRITGKFFWLVFLVSFFIIIVSAFGAEALRRVWQASEDFASVDVPVFSNLYTIEEISSKQSFTLESLTVEKNANGRNSLAAIFNSHTSNIENSFGQLGDALKDPTEISLSNKAHQYYEDYLSAANEIILPSDIGNKIALQDTNQHINLMRDSLYKMSDLVKERVAKNAATLSETHSTMRNALFLVSFLSLLFAALVAIIIGRKTLLAPVLSVERHAEELSNLNRELSLKNKLLLEREEELSQTNKKLQSLDTARSEFVSLVAHQLRTPLAGIKWSLDMLINGDMGELKMEQKSMLFKMSETNERIVRFVNDLLSVSRIESGRLEYSFVPTNLEHVAESVLLDIYPLSNRKQISINFRGKGISIPMVAADTEKIRAVFQNLLENAVKYTPEGGHVTLDIRNRGSEVLVSVADEGIGIPKEEQKNIFKRFFRASSAIKIQSEGSGLGLYLARAIVEGHGGRLWFESEPGKGSSFYFTIPIPRKIA